MSKKQHHIIPDKQEETMTSKPRRTPLTQQLGQLFISGFKGEKVFEYSPIIRDIKENNLSGVILFDRHLATKSATNNIVSQEQVRELTFQLQNTAATPLLIAVDQEGGQVSRFRGNHGFTEQPSAQQLALEEDCQKTVIAARQTASFLCRHGVNLNLGPVADINIQPQNPIIGKPGRSFSPDVKKVTKHCRCWIEEHKKHNILTSLKHFPGHGSSLDDSHLGFVDITETWQEKELTPYKTLIKEGLCEAVMVGHLYNKRLDETFPATLSKKIITDILKKSFHFKGPVITDDMQMRAITEKYPVEEACCMAIEAGADLVIIGNNLDYTPDILPEITARLKHRIDKGRLDISRIQDALGRIQQFKAQLNRTGKNYE